MKIIYYLLIFLTFFNCIACKDKENKKVNVDGFYIEKGEWDLGRIPFIKPYEAVIVNKQNGWCMHLFAEDGDTGFCNIKKANVTKGLILIYSEDLMLRGIEVKQSWQVIIPCRSIEQGVDSHEEYLRYLSGLGLKSEPLLIDIELAAKYFEDNDIIDWKLIR